VKVYLVLFLLICLAGLAYAQKATSPVSEYLKNPDSVTYRRAVDALSSTLARGDSISYAKLTLATLTNSEAKRLTDELIATSNTLTTGERFNLANLLLAKKEYAEAITLYDGLNRDYPDWSCPWRHKGEAYFKADKYTEAESALQKAIATNVQHYDAYIWMAYTLNELERYPEAMENLEKAKKLSPEAEGGADETISSKRIDELYQELKTKTN